MPAAQWLDFDVCWQRHTQFTYERIIPPVEPPNLYSDYLRAHGEGVQYLGVPLDDLEKSIAEYQKLGYSVGQSGAWGETGKKGSAATRTWIRTRSVALSLRSYGLSTATGGAIRIQLFTSHKVHRREKETQHPDTGARA